MNGLKRVGGKRRNWNFPFPVSPKRGKPGREGSPTPQKHCGSPHKRAAAPLCIPRRFCGGTNRIQWRSTKYLKGDFISVK